MNVVLNSAELDELSRQHPATSKDGGFQGLLVSLQEKTDQKTGKLSLSPDDPAPGERCPIPAAIVTFIQPFSWVPT
jgi:hypothetical protein